MFSNAQLMSNSNPEVSVVLPLYNGEKYLQEAIDSILRQTFPDFELVILDDGSTDTSSAIAKSYNDPRIRFYRQENAGLAAALNNAIGYAKGKYIARMDQDDISSEKRLEIEHRFLEENIAIGLVGTWISIIDDRGKLVAHKKEPVTPHEIRRKIQTYNCFNHGTVMFRRSVYDQAGGYLVAFPESTPNEDYSLWLRMLEFCEGENIPQFLYFWRRHPESISSMHRESQQGQRVLLSQRYITLMIERLQKDEHHKRELAYCYYSLGKIYYHQRKTAECRENLLKAIHLDPLVAAKAYFYLGISFISKGLADRIRRFRNSLLSSR